MRLFTHKHYLTSLFCATIFAAAFFFYTSHPLLSDVSYFVESSKRILQGAVPYRDILENNPPLAFWITLPPVWLAETWQLNSETVFVFYALSLTASVIFLLWQVTHDLLLVCIVSIVFCFSLAFGFGQREYFASLFFLPYIASVAQDKRQHEVLIGLLLGLAVCFKPYFALMPILVELYAWRGIWRKDLTIGVALSAIYPLLVWFQYPQYYSDILPLVLQTYQAYDAPLSSILLSSTFVLMAATFILTLLNIAISKRDQIEIKIWLAAAVGAAACHLLQHKGWPYQLLPAIAFVCVAFLKSVAILKNKIVQMAFVLCYFAMVCIGLADFSSTQNFSIHKFDALLGQHKPKSLTILSYDIGDSFPFFPNHELQWNGHFQSLWMMAAVAKNLLPPEKRLEVTQQVGGLLIDDFLKNKPEYVIVDQRAFASGKVAQPENPLQAFSEDPKFKEIWQEYTKVNSDAGYEIWKRSF